MLVGIVSDTHGLLRPEVPAALQGVEHILHAGDVGDPGILEALEKIAPVTAIRGNIDTHGACSVLPKTEAIELGGRLFYLVHSHDWLEVNPAAAGIDCVVSGHSHRPLIETRNGVLYVNPGSCGPRRFRLPVTLATLETSTLAAQLLTLAV
jgi:putative phosphoesterase